WKKTLSPWYKSLVIQLMNLEDTHVWVNILDLIIEVMSDQHIYLLQNHNILNWILEQEEYYLNSQLSSNVASYVLTIGDLEIAERLYQSNIYPRNAEIESAFRKGDINVLEWMMQRGLLSESIIEKNITYIAHPLEIYQSLYDYGLLNDELFDKIKS